MTSFRNCLETSHFHVESIDLKLFPLFQFYDDDALILFCHLDDNGASIISKPVNSFCLSRRFPFLSRAIYSSGQFSSQPFCRCNATYDPRASGLATDRACTIGNQCTGFSRCIELDRAFDCRVYEAPLQYLPKAMVS
jgi:hypothetical protein